MSRLGLDHSVVPSQNAEVNPIETQNSSHQIVPLGFTRVRQIQRPTAYHASADHCCGKAMFQIMGALAEFERAMICKHVKAGLDRARAQGKTLGRPRIDDATETAIRGALKKVMRASAISLADSM
jgi:hypothetical protein